MPWNKLAKKTLHQFMKGWCAIWATWLLLYVYLCLVWKLADSGVAIPNSSFGLTVDFLNIPNGVAFFYVFLVLDMPSVPSETEPNRNHQFRKALLTVFLICGLVFVLDGLGRFGLLGLREIGPFLSGFLVGISMAYVFGRLDSHYMNVKRWMLAPLYLYALIQVIGPLLVTLRVGTEYRAPFYVAALLLKVYLFFVISYWLQNGAFERYFNAAPQDVEEQST